MQHTTVNDYHSAVAGFLADIDDIGSDLLSVLLYGSLARNNIRPGHSDILDAYVCLRSTVFEDRSKFMRALEAMVTACTRLSHTGLPFHPFHYFSEDELERLPATYLAMWRSSEGQVLAGADVRSRIDSSPASLAIERATFFNVRRTMGYFLSRHLQLDFKPGEAKRVARSLVSMKKHLLPMACAVLDIWTVSSEAPRELENALPGIDMTVLQKIDELDNSETEEPDPGLVRETLRDSLLFMERLNDILLPRLSREPA
jgi:hypothetical protein